MEALNDLARKKRAKASKSSPERIQPLVPKLDLSLLQVGNGRHSTRQHYRPSHALNQMSTSATTQLSGRSLDGKRRGTATGGTAASAGSLTARNACGNGATTTVKQPLSARGHPAQLKVGNDGITCFDIRTPRSLL